MSGLKRWLALVIALGSTGVVGDAHAQSPRDPVLFLEGVPLESGLRTLILQEANGAYRELREWFGADVDGPISITWIADPQEFTRRLGHDPGTVAGVAVSSRNEIYLQGQVLSARPQRLPGVIRHEICHLLFAAATADAELEPPRWLNEGVAMWRSAEWDLGSAYRRDQGSLLRDASAAGALIPLRRLDGRFPTGTFFRVAYAQSLSFVQWMVRRNGEQSVRALLGRLNADEDPEPAFAEVYGLSLEEAEAQWREEFSGGGPWRILPSGDFLVSAAFWVLGALMIVRFGLIRRRLRQDRLAAEEEEAAES